MITLQQLWGGVPRAGGGRCYTKFPRVDFFDRPDKFTKNQYKNLCIHTLPLGGRLLY